ncbi:hypothetical protein [Salinigranum sp. GCM10025319]|uniref:hypothetical protein n=1 Tax=Salinigranum sp. GCM10025319 TaxID=3252687 RepID=UPI00361682DB
MHTRDGWKEHELTDGMIETFLEYGKSIPPGTEIAIPHLGGATNKRLVDATAYPHRDFEFTMILHTRWGPEQDE